MRGMQCPKMLWLDAHKPEKRIIPAATQKRLDRGTEFGEKAMGMFGPFVNVQEYLPNTKYLNNQKLSDYRRLTAEDNSGRDLSEA